MCKNISYRGKQVGVLILITEETCILFDKCSTFIARCKKLLKPSHGANEVQFYITYAQWNKLYKTLGWGSAHCKCETLRTQASNYFYGLKLEVKADCKNRQDTSGSGKRPGAVFIYRAKRFRLV
jgi:hypothetical protein